MLPRSKNEWIITVGWGVYIIIALMKEFLFPFDPIHPTCATWIPVQIGAISLNIAVTAMIVYGVRRIGREGRWWKNVSILAIGTILPLALICFSIYGYHGFEKSEQILMPNEAVVGKLAEKLKGDFPPEKLTTLSKMRAKLFYREYGEIRSYSDLNGREVPYEPTEEDKDRRNMTLEGKKLVEWGKQAMLMGVYTWAAVIFVGILLGVILRRRQAKLPL